MVQKVVAQRPDMYSFSELQPTFPPPFYQYLSYVRHMPDYMRIFQHRHASAVNRGASQAVIERNTFPHKYKKIQRSSEAEDSLEKCTICLCEFEDSEDVR